MKYIILILAFISTLSAFDWPDDYNGALAQAKKEKKDVYLMIGSATCPWCEKFENDVLMDKEVVDKLKKDYILLYLSKDIDDIPEGLKTSPIPRHYFLDEKGRVIYTTMGYRSKERFYGVLEEVKDSK